MVYAYKNNKKDMIEPKDSISVKLLRRAAGDYEGSYLTDGYIVVEIEDETTRCWIHHSEIYDIREHQRTYTAPDGSPMPVITTYFKANGLAFCMEHITVMQFLLEVKLAEGLNMSELVKGG